MQIAASSTWSTQQLAEFLVAVTACTDRDAAVRCAVQWAAESVDAEVAAVLSQGRVLESLGFPRGTAPESVLAEVAAGERHSIELRSGAALDAASVPVDDPAGSLVVGRSGPGGFGADELALLRAMSRSLSMTLRLLDTVALLQERQRLFERLSKIQASISRRAPLPDVLDAIVKGAHELLGDEVVALRLIDRENPDYIRIASAVGLSRALLTAMRSSPVTEGAGGRAIVEDRLVTFQSYQQEALAIPEFKQAEIACAMAAPVHENAKPIGSIVVASYNPQRVYSDNERDMLLAFAHHASIALNDATAMDRMRHMAFHDPLTSLPNRALFVEQLDRALANAARARTTLAVLFVDLDRFKLVNDSLGHTIGDRLLEAVAARLRGALRAADLAARLSGDEFAVLIENTSLEGASAVAETLAEALLDPFVVGDHELAVTASIGVAVDTGGVTDAESLLRNADLAMYRTKLEGHGRHMVYEPAMHEVVSERVALEGNLRRAVALEQFVVHYQPIVDLRSGHPVSVEALVRWRRDDRTLLPPAQFVPIAEEMGLIVPIGRLVMREAMRQVRRWQRTIPRSSELALSVNLSARQLYQPDIVRDIVDALDWSGLPPRHLTVEVTETSLMHDTTVVSSRLGELRELGVEIALDDFGTGYSSLSYLRNFPISVVKVDKSFINDIARESESSSVAQAIIELGRTLNLEIVAEGVEDAAQVAELIRLQCQLAQGYHFARPLAARDAGRYLRSHSSRAPMTLVS
jgi:diguanylate cyclase (GGDEF)-like protein